MLAWSSDGLRDCGAIKDDVEQGYDLGGSFDTGKIQQTSLIRDLANDSPVGFIAVEKVW